MSPTIQGSNQCAGSTVGCAMYIVFLSQTKCPIHVILYLMNLVSWFCTINFVLEYAENSNQLDSKIDDLYKNVPTKLTNIPMMKCKYNFIQITSMGYTYCHINLFLFFSAVVVILGFLVCRSITRRTNAAKRRKLWQWQWYWLDW